MKIIGKLVLPLLFTLSCTSVHLNKGEVKEIEFFDSEPQKVDGLKITCGNFTEVFISEYNADLKKEIHSSYPVFDLTLKKDGAAKTFSQLKYGSGVEFEGYKIKVAWSVVGTRDFKSNAKLKISKSDNQ